MWAGHSCLARIEPKFPSSGSVSLSESICSDFASQKRHFRYRFRYRPRPRKDAECTIAEFDLEFREPTSFFRLNSRITDRNVCSTLLRSLVGKARNDLKDKNDLNDKKSGSGFGLWKCQRPSASQIFSKIPLSRFFRTSFQPKQRPFIATWMPAGNVWANAREQPRLNIPSELPKV